MLIEIIRQSLYTRDIQPTSKPLQICGHLRSCDERPGYCLISFLFYDNRMLAERAFYCLLLMFHQGGISKELFSGGNPQLVVNILIVKFQCVFCNA